MFLIVIPKKKKNEIDNENVRKNNNIVMPKKGIEKEMIYHVWPFIKVKLENTKERNK